MQARSAASRMVFILPYTCRAMTTRLQWIGWALLVIGFGRAAPPGPHDPIMGKRKPHDNAPTRGWALLVSGLARAALLVLHDPIMGYGNQYDMHRTGACVGLYPAVDEVSRGK